MQHISGYNDLMNESFITDLARTWNGQICARAGDLWVYQWLYPCASSPIHSCPRHLPHCCLLQLESPLAIPASSNPPSGPAPAGCYPAQPCRRYWQQGFGVPGHPFHPWLTQPFTSSACRSMYPADLQCQGAAKKLQRWVCSKTKLFFLKNYVTGIGFGFFSDLLHLWVESCDSVPVSSQCYNLLCRWWLYQLGVFHIHTAFSIKCVGIGSSQSNWTRARGMFWFNCYRWSYSTTKTV